ncbi:MAG: DUF3306 domain-containing protein [Gammaproteobacteria bacterium]|nr:DUF3306 domain-containing protein [Gammaproteobacteria bacterium]
MNRAQDVEEQEEGGYLQRWSRRKQEVKAAEAEEAIPLQAGADIEAAPALTDEDMPSIECLTESSDYSGFLSPKVSDELRRVALRKLFNAAVFNQRDGLDDYDDDFTSFAKLGDIITSDMQHQIDTAKEKLEKMVVDDGDVYVDETCKETTEQTSAESDQAEMAEVVDQGALEDDAESEL